MMAAFPVRALNRQLPQMTLAASIARELKSHWVAQREMSVFCRQSKDPVTRISIYHIYKALYIFMLAHISEMVF